MSFTYSLKKNNRAPAESIGLEVSTILENFAVNIISGNFNGYVYQRHVFVNEFSKIKKKYLSTLFKNKLL